MSYAEQPASSVFSKNGDFRYHGPKYRVEDDEPSATNRSAMAMAGTSWVDP